MNKSRIWWGSVALLAVLVNVGAYYMGRHSARRVTWLSELGERTGGGRVYLASVQVICANGKNLGILQIDVNLRNGKVRIVRNDAGLEPDCTR
jgi:cephalosporin hydroxylase